MKGNSTTDNQNSVDLGAQYCSYQYLIYQKSVLSFSASLSGSFVLRYFQLNLIEPTKWLLYQIVAWETLVEDMSAISSCPILKIQNASKAHVQNVGDILN